MYLFGLYELQGVACIQAKAERAARNSQVEHLRAQIEWGYNPIHLLKLDCVC